MIDWARLRVGSIGPERAFEAFVAQLFECWVHSVHGQDIRHYSLHGAGGDGGVEAFAILRNNSVVGLQAKWFPGNLDDTQMRQIHRSFDTALARYERLNHYVIALPRNLTTTPPVIRNGKSGKIHRQGGVDRWQNFENSVATNHPKIVLDRWDSHRLYEQLSKPNNHELRVFWFEQDALCYETTRLAWNKAKAKLRDRYIPDLHTTGAIEQAFAIDQFQPSAVKQLCSASSKARASFSVACRAMNDLAQIAVARGMPQIESLIHRAMPVLDGMLVLEELVTSAIKGGPLGALPAVPDTQPLWAVKEELAIIKDRPSGWYIGDYAKDEIEKACEATETIRRLHSAWSETTRPRAIVAAAGTGKTHACAYSIDAALEQGCPAVFISAASVDLTCGLATILGQTLDCPGWPLQRLLDALEGLAILHQASLSERDKGSHYSRVALVIDGIEESPGWERWRPLLDELAVESQRRPRLHIVATMRPKTAQRLGTNRFSVLNLSNDVGISLRSLFRNYCSKYSVNSQAVPWLGWIVRSPLDIRLIAEEFAGRTLVHEDGFKANVLGLFQRKLNRLEEEARSAAATLQWSPGLHLIFAVLSGLVEAIQEESASSIEDIAIIRRLKAQDDEFTAERVRFVLNWLVMHGLVDESQPSSNEIRPQRKRYRPATQHTTDYILAYNCAEKALCALRLGSKAQYPTVLLHADNAAILFATLLAEEGFFVTEDLWSGPIQAEELESDILAALSLVRPSVAQMKRGWVGAMLTSSTIANRRALRNTVVPVARIPEHPLGPRILDEVLRAQTLKVRDPIWSVPDDLGAVARLGGWADHVLDELTLEAEIDVWYGLPLLVAWTCSSVVERRRRKAREQLAVWGSRRLDDMLMLVDHMARSDDPQVVEDIVVAALGAVSGASVDDPAIPLMAELVDRLFFASDAQAWTPDVIVRSAARSIVERAANICPGMLDGLLIGARPPYEARGSTWPSYDTSELRAHTANGGAIVSGDLSWYVAKRCFAPFVARSRVNNAILSTQLNFSLDMDICRAVLGGQIAVPSEIRENYQAWADEGKRLPAPDITPEDHAQILNVLREFYVAKEFKSENQAIDIDEDELVEWACQQLRNEDKNEEFHAGFSSELNSLLNYILGKTAADETDLDEARDALLAARVRIFGWCSDAYFQIDDLILKKHVRLASHGERNPIATFQEKYVWTAVNYLAGELIDRVPVWDENSGRWQRPNRLEKFGTGMPDPLPYIEPGNEPKNVSAGNAWNPIQILPELFADERDVIRRTERWLSEAVVPDPRLLVRGNADGYGDSAILAAFLDTSRHQGCVDQIAQVATLGIPRHCLETFQRDARVVRFGCLYSEFAGLDDYNYASPALACWAPWLDWVSGASDYMSIMPDGTLIRVHRYPLVAAIVTHAPSEPEDAPHEYTSWSPAPVLRPYLGIVSASGDRYSRRYVDRHGKSVAIERALPTNGWDRNHHYLAMGFECFLDACNRADLIPAWAVRIWRRAPSALWIDNLKSIPPRGLVHRDREIQWLLFWNRKNADFDIIPLRDDLNEFHEGKRNRELLDKAQTP